MTRITVNPSFDIETGELLSHAGQYEIESVPMLFDRGAVKQAKTQGEQAGAVVGKMGSQADVERGAIVPGLIQEATHPTGFTPEQRNRMLVAQQEGAGGANAAITGEGRLAALRGRTAGGFAPAMAEAARAKGRTLATGALGVENENARLALQKQQVARAALQGLYGTDTSNMLKSMGIQAEDLQNQLAAGRQGWLQNTEGILNTAANMGTSAAGVKKAFG